MEQRVKEIGKDSLWYFTSTLIYSAMGFFSVAILSRLLTKGQYGIYSLCVVTIGFSMVLTSWLVQSIIRYYSVHEAEGTLDAFITTILRFMLYFSIAVICVVTPVAMLFLPDNKLRLVVAPVILISAGSATALVLLTLLRAKREARLYSIFYLSEASGRFILGIMLVAFLSMGPKGIFIGWLAALIIVIPLELRVLQVRKYYKRGAFSTGLVKDFLRYGIPLSGAAMMVITLSMSDRYLVQAFRGAAEVGLYSVVYTITSAVFDVVFTALPLSSEPVIVSTYENEGERKVRQIIRLLTKYAWMAMLPVGAGLVVLQSRFMHVVAGAQFFSANKAIPVLVVGFILERMVWFAGWGFVLKKKTGTLLWIISTAALSNIVLNLFMIPALGYMGAAISTTVSYLFSFIIMVVSGRKYLKWDFPWISALRITCAAALMSGALFLLDKVMFQGFVGLVCTALIGTLVYGVLLVAFRELHLSELKTIYTYALRKMGSFIPWIDND